MNVLFIASWYPNSTFIYQGIFMEKHAHAIKQAGVNIKIIAITINRSDKLWENKSKFFVDSAGIETQLIEINSRFNKAIAVNIFYLQMLVNKTLKKRFPDFKPDVIHSNVVFPSSIIGYKLSKKLNIPHVITEHWSKIDHFLKEGFNASSAQKAVHEAAAIMPVSNYLAGKMKEFVRQDQIIVVPNAVDTSVYNYIERDEIQGEELVFACLANWQTPKQPELIFEGLEKFAKNSEKKIRLEAMGGGALLDALKQKKWSFAVNYYGFIPPEKIVTVFKDVDFLLHASNEETFSIILAEAGIMGIPAVASNKGAMPELINESNGIVCENTVDDWAKAIGEIALKKFDRKKISDDMKVIASYEAVGNKYKKVYEKVTGLKN